MTSWVVLVDALGDFSEPGPHRVVVASDYLANPKVLALTERTKVVNLSRSYGYLSKGYYASLLAEARGHRVLPSVETLLELAEPRLYEHALPDLEKALNRAVRKTGAQAPAPFDLLFCFGFARDSRFDAFGRLLFDWFRCPALEVAVAPGAVWRIERLRLRAHGELGPEESKFFVEGFHRCVARDWRAPRERALAKYRLAVLYDPNEALPPSSPETLRYLQKFAERQSVEVTLLRADQLDELVEHDALFIRATTSLADYTYRFARRARQEGMPVIDDPSSMIRGANKVYQQELMQARGVPTPRGLMLTRPQDLEKAEAALGFPMVVKLPDGSFSRGVHKVENRAALKTLTDQLFAQADVLIAQEFLPTAFDWRVGVLDGELLFVCQYRMARGHWQIIKHGPNGAREGGFRALGAEETPKAVIETALAAARAVGPGFYGVDLKEVEGRVVVIEVNDNPNLEHGVEDLVAKDELWSRLIAWFVRRIDA